jgi:hypothetical protein
MTSPRFSVVIPTRERAHTLRCSLQTCLDQDFDDYEVVVCDNHSSQATRAVVEGFASPRIKYVRAPEPLAMSHNWELALQHANGEFVTVLGDDDGLLSHALRELDRLIVQSGARVVRWSAAFYLWPTVAIEGEGNYLSLPLGRELRSVEGLPVIGRVVNFDECYTSLPMVYNAVIHRDLIADLRARAGRVFANNCPDVYSGFVFGYLAGTYLSCEAPMSIAGLSGNSTGVAALLLRRPSAVAREFRQMNARAGLAVHPWVPDLPIYPIVPVADSFLHAKEALFPHDDRLHLDRRRLAECCTGGLWAADLEEWRARLAVIRATFADDPALEKWFDGTYALQPFKEAAPLRLRGATLGYDGSCLHLRTDAFGVTDVAGAARLCANLLGFRGAEIAYGLPAQGRSNADFERLSTELQRARAQAAQTLVYEAELTSRAEQIRLLHEQLAAERNTLVRRLRRAPGKLLRRVLGLRGR